MTLRFEDLGAAIERNDGPAVAMLLKGGTEAERRAVNAKVRALRHPGRGFSGPLSALGVAVLGTAAGARQAAQVLGDVMVDPWVDQAVEVLRDRNPPWLAELPRPLLTGSEFRNNWRLVRGLVRAGLVARPDVPEYVTKMPNALASEAVLRPEETSKSIEQQLLDDHDLLQDEIFRLFSVEGSATALYWADAWLPQQFEWRDGKRVRGDAKPEATWQKTLARLARRGLIDFGRLLDESIAVFLRDLRPTHFGWYVGMHDALAPTLDEMTAHSAQYQRLLAADTSLAVGVGQRALEQLLRADRLDLESFVSASGPPLSRGEKGIVVKQLKLLGQAVKQRPDLAPLVGEVLAPALTHERPEVREAAKAFADRLRLHRPHAATPTNAAAPASHAPAPDEAATMARAAQLVGRSPWSEQIKSSVAALETGSLPPVWTVPVGPGRTLPPPITEPEQVVEAFTRLVENARDPILIERAIAGAVRTARLPVEQRRRISEPLAKRTRDREFRGRLRRLFDPSQPARRTSATRHPNRGVSCPVHRSHRSDRQGCGDRTARGADERSWSH
jgi:uncharacterized protein DUF6493